MNVNVYTLWASLKDEPELYPWMIAAEDDSSWESDPDRCEAAFKAARDLADRNDWDVREITLKVEYDAIAQAFLPVEVAASADNPPDSEEAPAA